MDIRQLEYFAEVAKQLSFTKAAGILHVSQPSLSKAIQNMENELGVPLFYRSSKKLELTDAGQAVLINAHEVLYSFRNLRSELTDILNLQKGQISIGIPPIIGAEFFSHFISDYKERYPYIHIHLTEVGTKMIRASVESGHLDIGFVCNTQVNEQLDVLHILNDPLMLVVNKSHPLAPEEKVSFKALKDESFLIYPKDFTLHDRIIEACSENGFYPKIACESSQKDLMIALVASNLGVTILPRKICQGLKNEAVVSIPFSTNDLHLELGMIWRKNKYLSTAVKEFIATVHK